MSALTTLSNLTQRHILLISLIAVTLLNLYYLNTYPINIAAFDYPNYAQMIFSSTSNLIHASGYPWAARSVLSIAGVNNGKDIYDLDWLQNLQLIHFLFHLFAIAVCTFMCNKVFGKLSATLMCLTWGGSLFFMGGVNSIAPDWLQGDLLAIALLTALWGFNVKNHAKTILYVLSAIILTLAYLVKFNSLVIAPVIAILVIFDSKSWIWKAATAIISLSASVMLVFIFVETFHFPTTNARQLSYDHAWVLIDAIPSNYIMQEPNKLEINSLRWRALSAILPPDYFRAAAYQDINWGAPKEVRAPYLVQYNYLMNASRSELIDFTIKHPLPEKFNVHISAIPGYYYIGLPQTDALGIAVYKESVLAIPTAYIKKLVTGWLIFFTGKPTQLTPFESDSLKLLIGEENNVDGSVKLTPPKDHIPQHILYWNPAEKAQHQGMAFFGWMNFLTPPSWIYALLGFVSCIAIFKIQSTRKIFQASLLGLSTVLLVSSSLMLLGVRFKEMLALLPIVSIFLSFGSASCIDYYQKRRSNSNTLGLNGEPT
ncbi:hypothetical protein [Pseudomonas silesiensis]|uniref:hypothetical protein n=1 Tax=Pseudomonas silesiensis TaxID=1853130 RepID=UPI0030D9439D